MDNVEVELQSAAEEVQIQVRQGLGLDEQSVDRLRKALRHAAEAWADADVISRSAANLFVDLAWCLEACSYAYRDDEASRIKELAHELVDLVRACVTAPRGVSNT